MTEWILSLIGIGLACAGALAIVRRRRRRYVEGLSQRDLFRRLKDNAEK
jgi:LPXTG-motif cell wall-anchored protein